MIALIAVMLLTKEVTRPLKNESLIKGRVTVINTLPLPAPRSYADSSIDLSIWRRAEIPLLVPTGRLRMIKTIIRISPVPYRPLMMPV